VPKVSVITPVFNGARYIGEALDSLLAQTWQDWEAIVVNDGSTDETPILLKKYADPRIKVIDQENGGKPQPGIPGLGAASGNTSHFSMQMTFTCPKP
jgi:glycosyltransferase involved in cell wall biosynthesis